MLRRMFVPVPMAVFFGFFLLFQPVSAASVRPLETNDTFANKQWYLDDIHAREAWNVATGSRDVIVAVIDSGVDINHPDLRDTIWTNPNEIPGNGKDDDGDGFIDDIHGWNFVSNSSDVGPVPSPRGLDDAWLHGTAVASLIAAGGNDDIGVAGVAWRARILPVVVLGPDGYGADQDIVSAIRYAVAQGADIINLSLVGYQFDEALSQAVHEATSQGVLVVSAAGNSPAPGGQDLDALPGYPACDKGAAGHGQLTVTALTRTGERAAYANYGSCVDVSAPGENLFTARPTTNPVPRPGELVPGYVDGLSGTSLAAPLVSGLAALLKAEHPSWRGPELAIRIVETSDPVMTRDPSVNGKLGQGKINVLRAVTNDAGSAALGPFLLEASAPGVSPSVRILSDRGDVVSQFSVGEGGDRRGVYATFVRWAGESQPDVAVSMIGDTSGAWRVYRMDGVLLAAGTLGADIAGGTFLAASDVRDTGSDELFLGEADGRRAWIVSHDANTTEPFSPFAGPLARGMLGLTVMRPAPSFLVVPKRGSLEVVIIGNNGSLLASATFDASLAGRTLIVRRGEAQGKGSVYDLAFGGTHILLLADASGLHRVDTPITVNRWEEVPEGQALHPGWLLYDSWPR